MPTLSVTIPTILGDLQIYADPRKLNQADLLLRKCPSIFNKAYETTANQRAEYISRIAKACLNQGIPPRGSGVSWPPHTANTIKRIGEHTLLNWSSQYKRSIRVLKRGKRTAVGIPSRLTKTRSDGTPVKNPLSVSQVAKILEFGSSDGKIPSRPMWSYLWNAAGGDASYKKQLVSELRKLIRTYIK